jgi:hypothetical protein
MDPVTAVGAGLTVLGSKEILTKLLGPTADYLGEKVRGLVEKADINLDAILHNAIHKLGSRIDMPGQVNARVLKHIYDEGRFCEDAITRDYFGGILASSKTEDPLDDRGAAMADSIRGLSAYQLKTHYVIYHLFRNRLLGQNLFINSKRTRQRVCLFISSPEYYFTIAPSRSYKEDGQEIKTISAHVFHGLKSHFLIDEKSVKATKKQLRARIPKEFAEYITTNGCIFYPTPLGAELFMWAHGHGNETPKRMFSADLVFPAPLIHLPEAQAFVLPKVDISDNSNEQG